MRYIEHNVQSAIRIDSLVTIHYFEFSDQYVDFMETHDFWEMLYIDRGECIAVADEREIHLKQGDIYFHKPNERHMIRTLPSVSANIFVVSFYCESPAMAFFEKKKMEATLEVRQYISAIIFEAHNTFELRYNDPYMPELKIKTAGKLWAGEQSIINRLELMLIELVRKYGEDAAVPPKKRHFISKEVIDDELTLRIIDYLETKIYDRMSIEELCGAFSFSRSYLSRYFKKNTGYSLINYLNALKIEEAKHLIRRTKKNSAEISALMMFSNPNYFSTLFKQIVGMSPSEYRKTCLSANQSESMPKPKK